VTVCPHAAFEHPESAANSLHRESVEVRCFAIWESSGEVKCSESQDLGPRDCSD
jgi:hypothetical protein